MANTPFRVVSSAPSSVHNRPGPAPGPNPMAVYNSAAAGDVDMQTHVARGPRVHDHAPETPWPAVTPGAPNPMRLR